MMSGPQQINSDTDDRSKGKRKLQELDVQELSTDGCQNKKLQSSEHTSLRDSEIHIEQSGENAGDEDTEGLKPSGDDSYSRKSGTEEAESASISSIRTATMMEGEEDESKEKRDERRMEINRQRAKEIRKRKKKMVEDMQKQIIYLTLENNKLRTQTQMQLTEINLLCQASMPQAMMGNAQQQIDLLTHQRNFNSNELQEATSSNRGVPNSLLSRLNASVQQHPTGSNVLGGENPLSALSTAHGILGSSSANTLSSHVDRNQTGYPFSDVSSSTLGGFSASQVANALRGTSAASAPVSNLNLLNGSTNNAGASRLPHEQLASMLALQQQDNMNDTLSLVGSNLPRSIGTQESSVLSASSTQDEHRRKLSQTHELSNLLANASPEMKSNLLQTLQSDESDARILSMLLEKQQNLKEGPNNPHKRK